MAIITDPDWIDPEETTFDVEKPIRSEQGVMLAGNPIAIALGKPGAPRVSAIALADDAFLGRLGAKNTTSPQGLTGLDAVGRLRCAIYGTPGASTSAFQFSLSADAGVSWSGWESIRSFATTDVEQSGELMVDLLTGAWSQCGIPTSLGASNSGTVTGANFNAIRFRWSVSTGSTFIAHVWAVAGRV